MAKKTPPKKKKLAKREAPKPVPAKEEIPLAGDHGQPINDLGNTPAAQADMDAVAADHDQQMEEDSGKPRSKRNSLPSGKISHVCEKCSAVSTIYVDDPDTYDEKVRVALFKKRGSSYKPALCRWCVNRLPAAERKKIA